MSTLPALNYLSNAARTEGEQKVAFEDQLAGIKQIPGSGITETTLTIATGSVTPPSGGPGIFMIDTEAAAAQDDLANIVQTNLPDGALLLIRPANNARVVTLLHNAGGAGQISLRTGGAFTLGDPTHWLLLKRTGTTWVEVLRAPREGSVGVLPKTANYTVTQADRCKVIDCTANTFTLTLPAVAQAGAGFDLEVRNAGTGMITLDGNASETINGTTTVVLLPNSLVKLICTGTAWISTASGALLTPGFVPILRGHLWGMTLSNNGTDATNDIDVAAGSCASDDAVDANRVLLNPGAMTKQLDVAWAAGSAAGGRISSESLVDGQWFIYAFRRSGGMDDYCFSQSLTPTLPDSGTSKRLVGWIWRASAAIALFTSYETEGGGLEVEWKVPTLDINLLNTLTTSERLDAVKVPLSFSTIAHLNVTMLDATAGIIPAWVYCPNHTSAAPILTGAPLGNIGTESGTETAVRQLFIRTNASGQIAARAAIAPVDTYRVVTIGFRWNRRN